MSRVMKPWEDESGATNVDGFLKAFAKDDNTFWRMESGHAKNIIEELIERMEQKDLEAAKREAELKAEVERLRNCNADTIHNQWKSLRSKLEMAKEEVEKIRILSIDIEEGKEIYDKCLDILYKLTTQEGGV